MVGYPEWWDFTKKPRKKIAGKAMATPTQESQPTANVAHSGNVGKAHVFSATSKNSTWIIDTGASDHMTSDCGHLQSISPSSQTIISTANGSTSPITCVGSVILSENITLDNVIVVPSLECNLLSVSQITSFLACTVTFWPSYCVFQDIVTRKILGYGIRQGKLYYLDLTEGGGAKFNQANQVSSEDRARTIIWLWHRRLGHLSFGYLKKLQPHLFSSFNDLDFHCNTCELAKNHRVPYLPSLNKSSEPFAVIHSDVWGPAKIPSLSQARYFVTFIDECTRMTWVSLLHHKSDVYVAFQEFHSMVRTQYQKQIRVLQSDNGTEFVNTSFSKFLNQFGIRHQTSYTYTRQQNGLAERKNRQLLEVVRASLFGMNMPRFYWGEAIKSAAYLINRIPSRVLNFETPLQKMNSLLSVPHLPNLEPRVFGCTVYVHIPKHQRNKLDPCAKKCVFVGYSDFQKGYRCYDPATKKLHVTLYASFHESESYYFKGVYGHSPQGESTSEENVLQELNEFFDQRIEKGSDGSHEILGAPTLFKQVSSEAAIEDDSVIPLENESDANTISESVSVELPMPSPSTAESTQNDLS